MVYRFGDVFESRTGHIGIARLSGLAEDEVRERLEGLFAGYSLTLVADHPRHPPLYRVTGCDFHFRNHILKSGLIALVALKRHFQN